MPHPEKSELNAELTGPKHGFAGPDQPSEFDRMLESAPEISALEHAIRMAPAGWCFDGDEADSAR